MKKIIFLILVLFTFSFSTACTNNKTSDSSAIKNETTDSSDTVSEQENTSSKTETEVGSSSEKLNVTVPDGWNKVAGSVLEHQYMKNTASFMMKTENFYKNTLDEVVAQAESIFQNTFDEYESISIESITVAGKDAKKLIFTCKISGISMKYMYVYLFLGKNTYAITFGDMQSSFDSLSEDYDNILKSITVQ